MRSTPQNVAGISFIVHQCAKKIIPADRAMQVKLWVFETETTEALNQYHKQGYVVILSENSLGTSRRARVYSLQHFKAV